MKRTGSVRLGRVAGKTAGMVGGGFAGALVASSGEMSGGFAEPGIWVLTGFLIFGSLCFATLDELWSNEPSAVGEDAVRASESDHRTAQEALGRFELDRRAEADALLYLIEHSRVPGRRSEWNRRKQLVAQLRESGRGRQEGVTDAG